MHVQTFVVPGATPKPLMRSKTWLDNGKPSWSCNQDNLVEAVKHHIRYFGRFPVSPFNDSLGGVDLVHFRLTQPKLCFPKIMEFSH